jgi:Ribophorin I.
LCCDGLEISGYSYKRNGSLCFACCVYLYNILLLNKIEQTWLLCLLQVDVETVCTHLLTAHPASITQKEKQLVMYHGNHYFYSPYRVAKQTTVVNLGTRNIESYTKLKPVSQTDSTITYGPYENIRQFSIVSMNICVTGDIICDVPEQPQARCEMFGV